MNDSLLRNAFQLHQSGRVAEAARLYDQILKDDPDHCDALYLLGVAHFQRGEFADALRCHDRALCLKPNLAEAYAGRGAALSSLGRHDEALAAYGRALDRNHGHTVAWNHPDNAMTALEQRAVLLVHLNRHADAIADYDQALARDPANAHLLYKRANALSIAKYYPEAIRDCEAVLCIAPDYPYARGVLVHSRLQACDWRGLEDEKVKISVGLAVGARVISPFNHKAISDSPAEQLQCARVWVTNEYPPAAPLWRGERYAHDRIRLAYVSADFNNSANASLMAGVYEHHDRKSFETVAISIGAHAAATPVRARLEAAFDQFLDMREKSPSEIAHRLRTMEIDIAVDLMGFTGECRPGIFAARPAPVQVNYLGFPGSMGADYIDYILADRTLIPERNASHYSEKIVYLPDTYQANDSKRAKGDRAFTRAELGLPENAFVFCGFHNAFKITPQVFDVWMRLLNALPGSVLWLLEDNPSAPQNLKHEAEQRGTAAERLIFPNRAAAEDHLARQRVADLFLDTFTCNAHTTASDALWVGLPVLTLTGESFAGRVAASLLTALGLPELITQKIADYETLALKLAKDPATLSAIRNKIARHRDTAPLFDTARFTRNLEAAYRTMWERHQSGEAPASFAVGSP